MGSRSTSKNTSVSNYLNLPLNQSDVTNPLNLVNSTNARLGSTELASGNYVAREGRLTNKINSSEVNVSQGSRLTQTVNNNLDGGAIAQSFGFGNEALNQAFDFGSQAVQLIADITANNNQKIIENRTEQTGAAVVNDPEKKADDKKLSFFAEHKTGLLLVAAAVAWWYWGKK